MLTHINIKFLCTFVYWYSDSVSVLTLMLYMLEVKTRHLYDYILGKLDLQLDVEYNHIYRLGKLPLSS